jgi:hypothetical protein
MNDWIKRMVACLTPEEVGDVNVNEALAIKYQNRPKSVFKYRCDNEKSRYNLENDLVWVCSPTSYNDPYDSSVSVTTKALIETVLQDGAKKLMANRQAADIEARKVEQILSARNPALALQQTMVGVDPFPPEFWQRFVGLFEVQEKAWEEAFGKSIPAHQKDTLKVCSFSGTPHSIIMWSHYADEHRGFCIEYDTESLPQEHLFVRMLYPVIYSEKLFEGTKYYLAAMRDRKTFNILFLALAALHKSPEWSYEKEWRLVIPAGLLKEASPWRIPTPKRVYLGTRMPDDKKRQIIEICTRKGIEIHQMDLADDSFCLRSQLIASTG